MMSYIRMCRHGATRCLRDGLLELKSPFSDKTFQSGHLLVKDGVVAQDKVPSESQLLRLL